MVDPPPTAVPATTSQPGDAEGEYARALTQPAVRCDSLVKRFGNTRAVDSIDLDAWNGNFLALLGPSGCGKTSTLRLIAGFERPDSGTIQIDGETVAANGVFVPPEHRRVGMVFQDGALFPHMTVAKNVAYGLPRSAGRDERVARMLDFVGLSGLGHRMPHELSGGQQQRVALARALAPRPTVILLDEPFASLDVALRTRLRGELRTILRRAGVTAILVTHDQDEALSFADDVAVMFGGKIVQRATPSELYRRPASPEVASFLGEANLLAGEAADGRVSCELGELFTPGCTPGPVEVLVRPEAVRLFLDGASQTRVTDAEYYGHAHMFWVDLPSGTRIKARAPADSFLQLGDHVRIQVQGAVLSFPKR